MTDKLPNNLLESLHDVQFVAVEGSTLPGLGWWIVAAVVLIICVLIAYRYYRFIKNNRYRSTALALLKQASLTNQSDSAKLLAYNVVLKRVVLSVLPEVSADSLYGKHWLQLLNQYVNKEVFSPALIESWHQSQFSQKVQVDPALFYSSCKRWLKLHRTTIKEAGDV